MGRPSDYSQELADKICAELADGKSLRTVCIADDLPDKRTVLRWLATKPEFCHQYVVAKELSTEALVEEILEIADGDGEIQRDRLKVDSRKWLASVLQPKKYGAKTTLEGGDKPIIVEGFIRLVSPT